MFNRLIRLWIFHFVGVDHYENFPVASWLMPARLRRPIAVIYHFARSADDIADEGDASDAERLAGLDRYKCNLDAIAAGKAQSEPMFRALAGVIAEHRLPIGLFADLLSAFAQDVTHKRYDTFTELLDYCRRSANPIGRLLLHLFGANTPATLAQSDSICTALQLINFWQDVRIDIAKDRIYIPREDMGRFGIEESAITQAQITPEWRSLIAFEVERARAMLRSGQPLTRALSGRVRLEIAMVVQGGLRILEKIDRVGGDVYKHRPVLVKRDWLVMLARALRE